MLSKLMPKKKNPWYTKYKNLEERQDPTQHFHNSPFPNPIPDPRSQTSKLTPPAAFFHLLLSQLVASLPSLSAVVFAQISPSQWAFPATLFEIIVPALRQPSLTYTHSCALYFSKVHYMSNTLFYFFTTVTAVKFLLYFLRVSAWNCPNKWRGEKHTHFILIKIYMYMKVLRGKWSPKKCPGLSAYILGWAKTW